MSLLDDIIVSLFGEPEPTDKEYLAAKEWQKRYRWCGDYSGEELRQKYREWQEMERKWAEERAEYKRRRETVCNFVDGFSQSEFEQYVYSVCKVVKRISRVKIEGPFIEITVRTQSGISEWSFNLDFNDYGHITGWYDITSCENDESSIPVNIAKRIQYGIENHEIHK